jgi:hypothetical protein
MTEAKSDTPASLLVDYPCLHACQVEIDLTETSRRTTLTTLLERAGRAHKEAHRAEPPQRVQHLGPEITVRAMDPAVTA